jgi:steroid 5-alpha reductase family enzyme
MRSKFFAFLGFWVFQMIWVWVVSLPVIFLDASLKDVPIAAQDIVGWTIWGIGFILEAVADQSKSSFSNDPSTKGRYIKSGVWAISRHPNYAGEIFMWIGIFMSCASVFEANTVNANVSVVSQNQINFYFECNNYRIVVSHSRVPFWSESR